MSNNITELLRLLFLYLSSSKKDHNVAMNFASPFRSFQYICIVNTCTCFYHMHRPVGGFQENQQTTVSELLSIFVSKFQTFLKTYKYFAKHFYIEVLFLNFKNIYFFFVPLQFQINVKDTLIFDKYRIINFYYINMTKIVIK